MGSQHINSDLFSVNPKIMKFYAPYDRSQKRIMTLMNPTRSRLLFKILSNAAYNYCVTPNCGCIEPYNTSEVDISLNYFNFDSDRDYNHHFSVVCIRPPPDNCDEVLLREKILCIFKKIDRCQMHSVRLPIKLHSKPICIPKEELELLLPPETLNILRGNKHTVCLDHLRQMPLPVRPKKGFSLFQVLLFLAAIIIALMGALMQRHSIEQMLYMYLKLDQVEF